MSWDIFVQDFPPEATTVGEISDDFSAPCIGKRSEVIAKINAFLPEVDFTDPSWGTFEEGDISIEFSMGKVDEEITGFALHVSGGILAVPMIAALLDHLELRAVESWEGDFFRAGPDALEDFQKWRKYRDK